MRESQLRDTGASSQANPEHRALRFSTLAHFAPVGKSAAWRASSPGGGRGRRIAHGAAVRIRMRQSERAGRRSVGALESPLC